MTLPVKGGSVHKFDSYLKDDGWNEADVHEIPWVGRLLPGGFSFLCNSPDEKDDP